MTKLWRVQKLAPGKRTNVALFEDENACKEYVKAMALLEGKKSIIMSHPFDCPDVKKLHKDLLALPMNPDIAKLLEDNQKTNDTKTANEIVKGN